MLTHPTLDKLQALQLMGMYHALLEQTQIPEITALCFEERLGLLVDRDITAREDRRLKTRLHQAKLRQTACIEDIDYCHPRGLDKSLMLSLATCQWIRDRHNVLITGPTGIGKTWLACALGHQAGPLLPTSPRESRFSMAYSHPYERHPMTWRLS